VHIAFIPNRLPTFSRTLVCRSIAKQKVVNKFRMSTSFDSNDLLMKNTLVRNYYHVFDILDTRRVMFNNLSFIRKRRISGC